MKSYDDRIIELYGLVPTWVDDFIGSRPDAEYLRDDLEGEAGVKLVEVIRERPDAPQQVVRKAVENRLIDFVCEVFSPVPRRTAAGMKARGEQVPTFGKLPELFDVAEVPADAGELSELVEELEACCTDDLDRAIVAKMQTAKGKSPTARLEFVAGQLGIGATTARERFERISENFRNRSA